MLIDKSLLDVFHGKKSSHHHQGDSSSDADGVSDEKIQLLTTARQHGVEIDTVLKFYRRWQREGEGRGKK